jgi:hypothetical protein
MTFGNTQKLERSLALLLQYGTLFASLVMGAGVLFGVFHHGVTASAASSLMTVGVGLIILLPICRVLLVTFACVIVGEYRFACIAAAVLTIVALSCMAGLRDGF